MQTESVDFGFIYDAKKQQDLFSKMIENFSNLSKIYSVRTVLFTLENLDFEGQSIFGTIIEGDQIKQGRCEFPPFLYNFLLPSVTHKIEKMRNLRKVEGLTVINPINHFVQGIIFEMLTSLKDSQRFLLPSVSLNTSTFTEYLNKYDTLFLLPEKTFNTPKAVVINKTKNNNYMISIGQNGQICEKESLVHYIQKMKNNKKHLVMKGINCINWRNGPLEVRVYLQKDANGEWSVTTTLSKNGIFSRNAIYSSNTSYNRRDHPLKEIKEMEKAAVEVSLKIGCFLDFYVPFLGSCTLDYIFDKNYFPYLIYVNGFDQDQYLFQHIDSETQSNLLNNAFYYLSFLMQNYVKEKGSSN